MDRKIARHSKPAASGSARPTLKTIASITELGTTTVSRALKDAPDIGEKTKQRVREVAERIGYIPNRAGVGLRTGKTNVISLVLNMNEEVMGLTSHMVRGLSEGLSATPYHLTITPYSLNTSPLDVVRYIYEHREADGIILSRTEPHDERVRYLQKRRVPFATHGRTLLEDSHPYHDFDNEKFTEDAVNRLVAKRRTRIALLGPPDTLTFYHHTMAGYRDTLLSHQLEPRTGFDITIDDSLDTIETRTREIFSRQDRPDSVISFSGGSTIALCSGIEAAGLIIGKDVDIISKQSVNILPIIRPQIITIHEDINLAGRELARAVVGAIEQIPTSNLQTIAYPAKALQQ